MVDKFLGGEEPVPRTDQGASGLLSVTIADVVMHEKSFPGSDSMHRFGLPPRSSVSSL